MEPAPNHAPLVAIVGATASGKSALAMMLAKRFDGEVIAADARTFYKGMDIGTAKPSAADRHEIHHHLIDIATPQEVITAATFKALAQQAIADIVTRGKLPILVGGSGLYVDGLLFDYSFAPKADHTVRQSLEGLSVDELQRIVVARRLTLPLNHKNKRHLQRVIETGGMPSQPRVLREHTLILGVEVNPEDLRRRIAQRVDAMLAAGLLAEVQGLVECYGFEGQLTQTIGYREFEGYIHGTQDVESVRTQIVRNTFLYAKRQKTWFNRNKAVTWISNSDQAVDLVTSLLNK